MWKIKQCIKFASFFIYSKEVLVLYVNSSTLLGLRIHLLTLRLEWLTWLDKCLNGIPLLAIRSLPCIAGMLLVCSYLLQSILNFQDYLMLYKLERIISRLEVGEWSLIERSCYQVSHSCQNKNLLVATCSGMLAQSPTTDSWACHYPYKRPEVLKYFDQLSSSQDLVRLSFIT